MKKITLIAFLFILVIPAWGQRMTKEEKAALAKAAYETAVKCINEKSFVIVPATYTDKDGVMESNSENTNFISCESGQIFTQGTIVCDNKYTNVADATEYTPTLDKKGNLKLRIVVNGRMIKGTYVISMKANTNVADVIFTPASGTTRKFTGPVTPLTGSSYYKRSNPM